MGERRRAKSREENDEKTEAEVKRKKKHKGMSRVLYKQKKSL
jgi:hypothetical protein